MLSADEMTERILYRLSLDPQARGLAERLLTRFRNMVGDLPASAEHHHSGPNGLYQHSLEVSLGALEEFEGNIIMERKPDGSVDSFRSARNRPRWQYASFITALCHDLGKLFDLQVQAGDQTWCPLDRPYTDFVRRARKLAGITWRPEREHGGHAELSCLVLAHLITGDDVKYLGASRLAHVAKTISASHSRTVSGTPLGQMVSRADQASVEQAQSSVAAHPESKIALFIRAVEDLITSGEMGVNIPGGQVYVADGRAAIVVPLAVSLARDRLKARKIVLPPNVHLYNMLRNARLVEADDAGRCVRKIRVPGKQGTVLLSALIFPTDKVVPNQILPTLPPIQFEIEAESEPEPVAAEVE